MTARLCFAAMVMLCVTVLMAGCGPQSEAEPTTPRQTREVGKMAWTLTSTAFRDGERIPRKHTGDGEDVSPPLSWTVPPARTLELALICDDPDAPAGTFNHWVLYGLPAGTTWLPEAVPTSEALPKLV